MPVIKSAKKRVRQSRKAAVRNARTRRNLRDALKHLQAALASGDTGKLGTTRQSAQSALDQAVKKGLMHKNKAARKKQQLSAQVKAGGGKVVRSKPAAKKPAAKKPAAAKKSPAKTK